MLIHLKEIELGNNADNQVSDPELRIRYRRCGQCCRCSIVNGSQQHSCNSTCSGDSSTSTKSRPKVTSGSSEETWNSFVTRWIMIKRGTILTDDEEVRHLFHYCDDELGDAVLKGHHTAVLGTEDNLLAVIKQLAVIQASICVRRADLLSIKQDYGENVRSYFTRIKGKAATCSYTITCKSAACTQLNDFTDVMVKMC